MEKSDEPHQIISVLIKEARHSMDHEHFEDAVLKLQLCLQLEGEPEWRATILDELGYCFLRLGWFEEAVNIYTELLRANPFDNDSRFYLASAYASLKWTGESIEELSLKGLPDVSSTRRIVPLKKLHTLDITGTNIKDTSSIHFVKIILV